MGALEHFFTEAWGCQKNLTSHSISFDIERLNKLFIFD